MGTDIIVRDAHRHDHCLALTEPPKPTLRQALGDKRIVAVLLMSFASGLPLNLAGTGMAFQAWLASAGVDLRAIGFYSLVGLPYIFKFLWAPLLDRYLPPLLGRRRGWILVFQACLAVAIGVMGFSSPTQATYFLAAIALLVVFLSSSQDIVIDASFPRANAASPLPLRRSATARHRSWQARCSCSSPHPPVGTWHFSPSP